MRRLLAAIAAVLLIPVLAAPAAAPAVEEPTLHFDPDSRVLSVSGVDGARFFIDRRPVDSDRWCPCETVVPAGVTDVRVKWVDRDHRPRLKGTLYWSDSDPTPTTTSTTTTPPTTVPGECFPAHPSVLDRDPVSFPVDGTVIGHSNGHRFATEVVADNPGWVNATRGGHDASDWVDNKNGVYDAAIAANPDARAVVTVLSERITDEGGRFPPAPTLALYEQSMRTLIDRLYRDLPELETIILRSRMTGRYSEKVGNMNGEPHTFHHNEIMADLAAELEGVEFVNVWDAEGDDCRQYLDRSDFSADGIHPLGSAAAKVYDRFIAQTL